MKILYIEKNVITPKSRTYKVRLHVNISKYDLTKYITTRFQNCVESRTKETQKEESASEREGLGFDDEYIIKNQDI